jgi:phage N-6-adenine-methyltransferase
MKNLDKSTTPENEKDLAQTPEWFIESLCDLLGIEYFELDVCALEKTKKAATCYSLSERGENCLELDWDLWNWLNPPFSNVLPFLEKAVEQCETGYRNTAAIMPNNPETGYVRYAKEWADMIIEMPFRIKYLRPNGSMFLDKKGKEQSPQFSCLVAIFTPLGLKKKSTSFMYHDFREGFYKTK